MTTLIPALTFSLYYYRLERHPDKFEEETSRTYASYRVKKTSIILVTENDPYKAPDKVYNIPQALKRICLAI